MYEFINDYPYFRENGLSHECQGVCHDSDNWFFTQDGNLWKIPLEQDLNQKFKGTDAAKGVIKVKTAGHLGDIDYYGGYIFVPYMHDDYETYILALRADDLSFVAMYPTYRFGLRFKSIGWCAINHGYLYTSDSTVHGILNPIVVYKIDLDALKNGSNNFLSHATYIVPGVEVPYAGKQFTLQWELKDMQGGCFDDDNNLHIANGYWKNAGGREDQGIRVMRVPEPPFHDDYYTVDFHTKSNQKSGFKYKFDTSGQEPEGLTWWDLDKDPRAPSKERGQLHVILLDNDPGGTDDLVFKHFRRTK
jgi:hypothetical protein